MVYMNNMAIDGVIFSSEAKIPLVLNAKSSCKAVAAGVSFVPEADDVQKAACSVSYDIHECCHTPNRGS
jgi:hypothetical protein